MYSKKEHVHIQAIFFFFLGAWQKTPQNKSQYVVKIIRPRFKGLPLQNVKERLTNY